MPVHDPLREILGTYCHVEALELVECLPRALRGVDESRVRNQLSDAIDNGTITPREYESVTGQEFETVDELRAWLLELWEAMFRSRYENAP